MPMPSLSPLPIGTVAITAYDVAAIAAVADTTTAAPAVSATVRAPTIAFLTERAVGVVRRPAGTEHAREDAGGQESGPERLCVMGGSL